MRLFKYSSLTESLDPGSDWLRTEKRIHVPARDELLEPRRLERADPRRAVGDEGRHLAGKWSNSSPVPYLVC